MGQKDSTVQSCKGKMFDYIIGTNTKCVRYTYIYISRNSLTISALSVFTNHQDYGFTRTQEEIRRHSKSRIVNNRRYDNCQNKSVTRLCSKDRKLLLQEIECLTVIMTTTGLIVHRFCKKMLSFNYYYLAIKELNKNIWKRRIEVYLFGDGADYSGCSIYRFVRYSGMDKIKLP